MEKDGKFRGTPLLKEVKPDPAERVSKNMLSVHEILSLLLFLHVLVPYGSSNMITNIPTH